MERKMMKSGRKGFTLIELLVVVAIIALLAAIMMPALSAAREAAKASKCAMNLKGFGSGFEIYSSQDRNESMCSGAFDHLRDGDVTKVGWVADLINLGVANPGKMLCPTNRYRISEKVADYTGAAVTGSINTERWGTETPTDFLGASPSAYERNEFWNKGYNSNYATTWHFSRGDPVVSADGTDVYGSNNYDGDGSKCPGDGDGPLSKAHLCGDIAPSMVALMGDARQGDSSDSTVSAAYANTINTWCDTTVVKAGEYTVESFCDGMSVDMSAITGDAGRMGHEFNDIAPLHSADSAGKGGYANVLFADGHVDAIYDSNADSFIGAYKGASSFEIDEEAFNEIRGKMWFGRLRGVQGAGGTFNE